MLNLETISTILDEFGGAPISVHGEYCLNTRHKDAGCRLCVDACPTEAIELRSAISPPPAPPVKVATSQPVGPQQPHLDAERCVSCGLCLHSCPTDVFTQRGVPEGNLVQAISLLSENAVSLVCPQHGDPKMTAAPVDAVVRHKRCLASLSVSHLLEMSESGRRTIWLDDSPCAECPIGRAQPAIARTAETTNHLLEAFGSPAAIHTHTSHRDGLQPKPVPRPVIDGDQPAVSRRSFFTALSQLGRRTAATVIAEALPAPDTRGPVPVDQRLPHRIPASRERLYSQLKRLGTPSEAPVDSAGIPYADVIVDGDACSACRLCARFCPTGALRFVADEESFVLYFRSTICIDCGICAVACPEDAVSFGPQLSPAALIDNEPRPLVAGNLTPCAGCGELTAAPPNGVGEADSGLLCHVCRQGTLPAAPLKDTAGLIADLLKGLPDTDSSTDHELEQEG
ncbi:MAG: 4Fe-4S dicluster domain-containing protein [Chloroflexi bacterium]|nr:MAG: 4Fe-4S dicluster domain-containing protein [Chloroflexota bacterium]